MTSSSTSRWSQDLRDVNDGFSRCTAWRSVAENAPHTLKKGMRVFVAGKLVQRSWQDKDANKCQSVEIQVTHVGPDLQSATAEGFGSSSDGPSAVSSAEENQSA